MTEEEGKPNVPPKWTNYHLPERKPRLPAILPDWTKHDDHYLASILPSSTPMWETIGLSKETFGSPRELLNDLCVFPFQTPEKDPWSIARDCMIGCSDPCSKAEFVWPGDIQQLTLPLLPKSPYIPKSFWHRLVVPELSNGTAKLVREEYRRTALVPMAVYTPGFFYWYFGNHLKITDKTIEQYFIPDKMSSMDVLQLYVIVLGSIGLSRDMDIIVECLQANMLEHQKQQKLFFATHKQAVKEMSTYFDENRNATAEQIASSEWQRAIASMEMFIREYGCLMAVLTCKQIKVYEAAIFARMSIKDGLEEILGMPTEVPKEFVSDAVKSKIEFDRRQLTNVCKEFIEHERNMAKDTLYATFSTMMFNYSPFMMYVHALDRPVVWDEFTVLLPRMFELPPLVEETKMETQ